MPIKTEGIPYLHSSISPIDWKKKDPSVTYAQMLAYRKELEMVHRAALRDLEGLKVRIQQAKLLETQLKNFKEDAINLKHLHYLSPQANDWMDLTSHDTPRRENYVRGVLLYPRARVSNRSDLAMDITDWASAHPGFTESGFEIIRIKPRGKHYAIAYSVTAYYNHFDLKELED